MKIEPQNELHPRGLVLWRSAHPRRIVARVAIAGDFLPARKFKSDENADWHGMTRPLASHFEDADVTFVNLESPLDCADLPARPLCGLGDIISSSPACLDYLASIRAQFIGIANNHAYDFSQDGVERTRRAIAARSMTALGAGRHLHDDPEIAIWKGPDRTRVGFWAAARATSDPSRRDSPGVEPATSARALRALNLMKHHGATFCVALLHAGCLRTCYPDPEDVRIMDRIAETGFHVVAASHSHRLSGVKILRAEQSPSFCFYGLGSLVSGYVAHPLEREGLIVVAGLNSDGALSQIEVRPVFLADSGFGEVPSSIVSRTILDRFLDLSVEIENGSYEGAFYRDVSNGLLRLYVRDARRAFQQLGLRGLARKASRVRIRHMKRLVHKVTG